MKAGMSKMLTILQSRRRGGSACLLLKVSPYAALRGTFVNTGAAERPVHSFGRSAPQRCPKSWLEG
jgi:hypothetical protein